MQERQPLADFLEHARAISFCCSLSAFGTVSNHSPARADRQFGDLADMLAADLDAQRLRLQPIAVAGLAGHVGEIFAELLARPFALGLASSGAR